LNNSRSHVTWALNSVTAAADSAKKSIDYYWNAEIDRVQWISADNRGHGLGVAMESGTRTQHPIKNGKQFGKLEAILN
jgi:hypothetical protein